MRAVHQNHDGELQNKLKQSTAQQPTLEDGELTSGQAI